eukprot:535347_1
MANEPMKIDMNIQHINVQILHGNQRKCNLQDYIDEWNSTDIVSRCSHLSRVCYALKYYQSLLASKEVNHLNRRNEFIQFCTTSYSHCLNDYVHVICMHGNFMHKISQELQSGYGFKKCVDLNKCKCTERHFSREQNSQNENRDENHYNFYIHIFDTLHFYIYHLETMGLRCYSIPKEPNNNKHKKQRYLNCYDEQFSQMQKNIDMKIRKYHLKNIKRFDTEHNSKFSIAVVANNFKQKHDNTFVDTMLMHLKQTTNSNQVIALNNFLICEEFDTDCIVYDLNELKENNLLNVIHNSKEIKNMKLLVKEYSIKNKSFSTGLVFWYWPYYKNIKEQTIINQQIQWNENDFDGHSICDLFVEKHFDSLQLEAINSGLVNYLAFKTLVVEKANIYINTDKCKQIICTENYDELHFDIKLGDTINIYHLQSLILYTDFTQLCTAFSSTFRQIYFNETLSSVKHRNSKYYHISKN